MRDVFTWLLARADNTNAWIGFIGIILMLCGFHFVLLLLFILLLVSPEAKVSNLFKGWTNALRDYDITK